MSGEVSFKEQKAMKWLFRSGHTLAIATMMLGLLVTQARADRITISSGCAGLSCVPEPLMISAGSLSVSSLGADAVTNSDELGLAYYVTPAKGQPQVDGAGSTSSAISSTPSLAQRSRRVVSETPQWSDFAFWSFGARTTNLMQSNGSLALPTSNSQTPNFSVVSGAQANSTTVFSPPKPGPTFQASGAGSNASPTFVGPVVPEPTTMLLFGTGLLGAAAVLRKRLRGRRKNSKPTR
jgi:hypothetical protein